MEYERGRHFTLGIVYGADKEREVPFDPKVWTSERMFEACRNQGSIVRSIGNLTWKITFSGCITMTRYYLTSSANAGTYVLRLIALIVRSRPKHQHVCAWS